MRMFDSSRLWAMESERLKALHQEFGTLTELLKNATSIDQRQALLEELRKMLGEADELILRSKDDLKAMAERLRSLK